MNHGQVQSTPHGHKDKSVTLLGAKLAELHLSAKYLLFSRTPVGKRGAQRQKEGRPTAQEAGYRTQ